MANPNNLLYTKSHEWVQEMGDGSYRVGLTDYAQDQLGDLVFVNLPQEGDSVDGRRGLRRRRIGQSCLRRLQPGHRHRLRHQRGAAGRTRS